MVYQIDVSAFINNYTTEFRIVFPATIAINIVFGLTATILNSIVVIAMAKYLSLRNPSNALLLCLSLSDLGVGLICQPVYVVWNLIWLLNSETNMYNSLFVVSRTASMYFAGVSSLNMAEVSLERYLSLRYHLRYEAMTTVVSVLTASLFPWVFFAVLIILEILFGNVYLNCVRIILPMLIIQSVACYSKIFTVLRRHHRDIISQIAAAQQRNLSGWQGSVEGKQVCSEYTSKATVQESFSIQGDRRNQVCNQPAQHTASRNSHTVYRMTRYRKSVKSMLLVFLFQMLCYIPYFIVQIFGKMNMTFPISTARHFALSLVYINSSINPILYCYRIPTIRKAIKDLFSCRRTTGEFDH